MTKNLKQKAKKIEYSQEQFNQTEEIMKLIERIIKTHKMYSGKHPNLSNFRNELSNRLEAYLNRFSDLIITLIPGAYLLGEKLVYEDENISNSIVYNLYKAGIRNIAFMRGLQKEELFRYLDILIEGDSSESSDILTQLWEADFKFIIYHRIDTFFETDQENQIQFTQFTNWLRKKNTPVNRSFNMNDLKTDLNEEIQAKRYDKKDFYLDDDLGEDITVEDNLEIYSDFEDIEPEDVLTVDDLDYINNQLLFDSKETIERWTKAIITLAYHFHNSNGYMKYVIFAFKYIDQYIISHNYKPLFQLFYQVKTAYEGAYDKKAALEITKGFYKSLLLRERIERIVIHLEQLDEDNYIDFKLFLGQLNKIALTKIVDNFLLIKDKGIRKELINYLSEFKLDMTSYYLSALKVGDSFDVVDALTYFSKTNLPNERKIAIYKLVLEREETEIIVKIFELFNGYFDQDLSQYLLKNLKRSDPVVLKQILIYFDYIKQENALLKMIKFVETDHFLSWPPQFKKDFLGILTVKIGIPIKHYLVSLFDNKALKSKRGFEDLRIAVIYALGFLIDKDVFLYLKSISKKMMLSKNIKQEALNSLHRIKQHG